MRQNDVQKALSILPQMQEAKAFSRRLEIEFPQIELYEKYRVESTMNYDRFRIMDANRDIEHEKIIAKCILKVGLLPIPIIVNERFEIVDGQGRYMACKELGYPIFYMIVSGLRIEHVREINSAMTKWSIQNFIESYSSDRIEYSYLYSLQKRFDLYSTRVVTYAASHATGGSSTTKIKNGNLELTEEQFNHAIVVLEWLNGFEDIFRNKKVIGGHFESLCIALIFAYENKQIDNNKLEDKFRRYATGQREEFKFTNAGNVEECLRRIENIYNFKSRGPLVSLVNEYKQSSRRGAQGK